MNTKPFTVVYAINPEARWSTKAAIRAGDFVAAWRVRAISSRPEFAPYRLISSVIPSDHGLTATVTFAQPYADWRALFSQLVPKDREPVPGRIACIAVQVGLTPSGTGWELSSTSTSSVGLRRAQHWWGSEQPFSTVSLLNAPNAAVLADWANRHVVDVASVDDPDAKIISAASAAKAVTRRLALSSRLLDLEFQTSSGPAQNEALRRGLIAALDRQQVTTQLFGQASLQYVPAALFRVLHLGDIR
ncbi:MAG: ABC transporter substrate-binding protein, partial [Actinomycetes bacterium]